MGRPGLSRVGHAGQVHSVTVRLAASGQGPHVHFGWQPLGAVMEIQICPPGTEQGQETICLLSSYLIIR